MMGVSLVRRLGELLQLATAPGAGRALEATNCRRLRILEYRISCTYSIYSNYGALSGEGGGWATMLIYGT